MSMVYRSDARLTVVTAAYNAEGTIAKAVASALASGAGRVIVVDDGSTDRTAEIAASAGAEVVRQENAGASAARSRGARMVESEFVTFLDADDQMIPEGVAASIALLESRSELVIAAGRVVGFNGNSRGELLPVTYGEVNTRTLLQTGFGPWPPGAAVQRTSAVREAEDVDPAPLRPRFAEDYELIIRLSLVGEIARHNEPSLRYEMSGGKSVRNALMALTCKEQIRAHYAAHLGLPIRLMKPLRRRAAANRRIARAKRAAGDRLGSYKHAVHAYAQGALSLLQPAPDPRQAIAERPNGTGVFAWLSGQDDNIGDSLLRRPMLNEARSHGKVNAFVGSASAEYTAGLGVVPEDTLYRKWLRWWLALIITSLQRRSILYVNAGELTISKRGAIRFASLWLASLNPRLRMVWMGAACPGSRNFWSVPYRLVAKRARFVAFRDRETVDLFRAGVAMPDWAFSLGTSVAEWPESGARARMVISLRGDRPMPSDSWLDWAMEVARALQLVPTFVVQVERDDARARELSDRLGGDLIAFPPLTPHAEQERRVREVYREARMIVSDRLHGLIVAATEGAVPIGWVETSRGKIARHFRTAGLQFPGLYEGSQSDGLPAITLDEIEAWARDTRTAVETARKEILEALTAARASLAQGGKSWH